jgi:hypothetical protein
MKKTLSFEKETLRTLVSTEIDMVRGGQGVAQPTPSAIGFTHGQGVAKPTHTAAPTYTQGGGFAHPTSTAVGTFTPTAAPHPIGTFTPTAR